LGCTSLFPSGPVGGVNGATNGLSQPMVVVWEWQDDQGFWRPYSGQVSAYIERCLSPRGQRLAGAGVTSICLGQSDPSLAQYLIDIPGLKQFRQDTGKTRSIRRSLFAQSSGLGSGVFWEWANDEGTWTPYETRTSILLEHSYQARQGTADLSSHGYNYIVDLTSLTQVNKSTGFRRQVRRQCNLPFPLASSGVSPRRASGVPPSLACSCQQCLSHSSTGPMSNRSRHSFSSGSLNRPSLQSGGRAAAAHPTSVYSPYPRRPLSVGSMSWGSPWLPPTTAAHLSAPPLSSSSNGLSVPSLSVHLNGSTSVSSALLLLLFQDCIICMDQLSNPSSYEIPAKEERCPVIEPGTVGKFIKCGHTLHMLCMLAMYNNGTKDGSLQCPSCKTIYGEKTGTQPKGKMEIYSISQSVPGHPDCGTIQIIYSIPPGIQGPEHPNPGQPFSCRGFPRFCFLPDNHKGRKVLELLKVAWITTGEPDTVVWNGIHHKTEMMSNLSGHGFPDPNYLDNVLSELASQGVTEDCLKPHR
uniref:E3 ubiquitin-protein ligase n=1 Tax=Neogobius melanostomus TaxID=47308 RepID=A0A8C6UIV8_9GOBI